MSGSTLYTVLHCFAFPLYTPKTIHIFYTHSLSTAKQDYGAALYGFLSVGSMASNHFTTEVPEAVWSPIVHQRLRACCTRLRYHTHALIVCQLLEPVDYEGAFGIVRSNVGAMTEGLFTHLWDMTIIEYLICILIVSRLIL